MAGFVGAGLAVHFAKVGPAATARPSLYSTSRPGAQTESRVGLANIGATVKAALSDARPSTVKGIAAATARRPDSAPSRDSAAAKIGIRVHSPPSWTKQGKTRVIPLAGGSGR